MKKRVLYHCLFPSNVSYINLHPIKNKEPKHSEYQDFIKSNYFSVSFGKKLHRRGVDHWGHSINEPNQGYMDYKNWKKISRYPLHLNVLTSKKRKLIFYLMVIVVLLYIFLLPNASTSTLINNILRFCIYFTLSYKRITNILHGVYLRRINLIQALIV